MRPGTCQCQHKHIVLNMVNEQLVWENMTFPITHPITRQIVIAVFIRQRFTHRQQHHGLFQQFYFKSTLERQLIVFLKAVVYLTMYFVFLIFSSQQTTHQCHCIPLQMSLLQSFPLPTWQQWFPY